MTLYSFFSNLVDLTGLYIVFIAIQSFFIPSAAAVNRITPARRAARTIARHLPWKADRSFA
jgi:hypothetical protein